MNTIHKIALLMITSLSVAANASFEVPLDHQNVVACATSQDAPEEVQVSINLVDGSYLASFIIAGERMPDTEVLPAALEQDYREFQSTQGRFVLQARPYDAVGYMHEEFKYSYFSYTSPVDNFQKEFAVYCVFDYQSDNDDFDWFE